MEWSELSTGHHYHHVTKERMCGGAVVHVYLVLQSTEYSTYQYFYLFLGNLIAYTLGIPNVV